MKWIKEKLKRFKNWIIFSVLGVGIVMAAGQIMPITPVDNKKETKEYKIPVRNFDGIQYEELRRQIDWKYNEADDALSKAYYEGTKFTWKGKDYGILNKEIFDKLQAMLWARYEIMFHEENLKQTKKILESEYNEICTEYIESEETRTCKTIKKKNIKALEKINEFKNENIDIDL